MNPTLITYASYVFISICLTVWVARTLHKNCRVFLVDVFGVRKLLDRPTQPIPLGDQALRSPIGDTFDLIGHRRESVPQCCCRGWFAVRDEDGFRGMRLQRFNPVGKFLVVRMC